MYCPKPSEPPVPCPTCLNSQCSLYVICISWSCLMCGHPCKMVVPVALQVCGLSQFPTPLNICSALSPPQMSPSKTLQNSISPLSVLLFFVLRNVQFSNQVGTGALICRVYMVYHLLSAILRWNNPVVVTD